METIQIAIAAAITGPVTWPVAASLIARQQGNFYFSFLKDLKANGARIAFSGCLPYASYKLFGIGTQRGVQAPILNYLNGADRGADRGDGDGASANSNALSFFYRNVNYVTAGVVSGIVGGVMVTPIEQFKISLANRTFANIGGARRLFCSNVKGFRLLMAGAKITVWRNVVFDSVNALLYNNALRSALVDRSNTLHMALINAFAGVLTAVVDYPLDVLKTRIQSNAVQIAAEDGKGVLKVVAGKPLGIITLASCMVRTEGIGSLYFGLRQKLGLYFYVWFVYGIAYSAVGKLCEVK